VLDSGTTATTTQPAELAIAAFTLSTFGRTCTKDANYSTFNDVALGSTLELCAEYQLLSATGAQNATGSYSGTAVAYAGVIATYK